MYTHSIMYQILNIHILYSVIPTLGIYPGESLEIQHLCTKIFSKMLFITFWIHNISCYSQQERDVLDGLVNEGMLYEKISNNH